MKKRSKYRPRPQLADPLNWVLGGLKPLTTATDEVTLLRTRNHGAIVAIRDGTATIEDADALLGAFNMAEALAKMGIGEDWLPEIAEAQQSLRNAGKRSRFAFTGPELTAINLAMDVHDAQVSSPRTTVAVVAQALETVKRDIRLKRAEPLYFPTGATQKETHGHVS